MNKLYFQNVNESIDNQETNSFDQTFVEKTKIWTINEARSVTDLTQRDSYRILRGIPGNTCFH